MDNEFFSVLREYKPKSSDITDYVFSTSNDDLLDMATDLTLALRPEQNRLQQTKHSFVANSALSGGAHPCFSLDCRTNKLKELASFATLYSDEVFIQDPFEKIILKEPEYLTDKDRQDIMFGIFTYQTLYPLIETGIVKFAQSTVSLCKHHFNTTAKDLHQQQFESEDKIYKGLKDIFIDKCSFEVNISKNRKLPYIKITGPEYLVEHGETYLHFSGNGADSIQHILKSETLPYRMKDIDLYFNNIIERWIKPVIDDIFYQKWHATFYNTKLLTDNNFPLDVARASVTNEEYVYAESLYKNFQHFMPAITNRPLEDIIEFRNKETEAFLVYRDKLNSLIKNSYGWSEKQIREMFEDELVPEINQINFKLKNWKSNLRVSANQKLMIGSASVAVGLVSGILPENIAEIITAVGGYSVLESYNQSLKPDNEARNNDLYFLWKMNR